MVRGGFSSPGRGCFPFLRDLFCGRGLGVWGLEEEGEDEDRSSEVFVVRVIGFGD